MYSSKLTKKVLAIAMAAMMLTGSAALSVDAAALDLGTLTTQSEAYVPLNGSGSTLTLNQTYQLSKLIYKRFSAILDVKINNTGVLQYKDGIITAVGTGTATASVTFKDGKTMDFTFTVKIPEKKITLNRSSVRMKVGQSSRLTAKLKNSSSVIQWTSSDTRVVSVDNNGKLKAVGTGTAVITASTKDGISAVCNITVNNKKSLFNFKTRNTETNVEIDENKQVTASVNPADNAEKKRTFSFSIPKTVSFFKNLLSSKSSD